VRHIPSISHGQVTCSWALVGPQPAYQHRIAERDHGVGHLAVPVHREVEAHIALHFELQGRFSNMAAQDAKWRTPFDA
jgi:hypothetical protein